jgi:hypothetical protein
MNLVTYDMVHDEEHIFKVEVDKRRIFRRNKNL